MAGLRAVVLAAGRGLRMGGGVPKTLAPLDGHEPLLFYILRGLRQAGVDDLVVVTGHRRAEVEEFTTKHWSGSNVSFVLNARFASWGNFHSLRVGLDQSPGFDVLVVNSDVVVHPDVYRRVATAEGDLVLAVERKLRLDQEDMRVQLEGNVVRGIGKDLKMGLSHGEYTGVSLVRPVAARAYVDAATTLEWQARTNVYYEDVYAAILHGVDVIASFLQAGEYAEVDEPADVGAAIAVIESHAQAWAIPA